MLARVARDARLDGNFLLLMTLSSAVATLGLLQGSTAVVIGAMLISPLMGPIIGLGFAVATIDSALVKRSLLTLAAGTGLAILVAAALIWLSPMRDVTDELRARTEPTLLDLAIAVVGGIAGVYAVMRRLSGTMVGVAIATALVPPLSTIAFGLVTSRPDFALGASLLFLTNTLAIAFAATVVARLNRFGPSLTPQHTAMQAVALFAVLGMLSVPLALSLNRLARQAAARQVVQKALSDRLGNTGRIDTLDVSLADGKVSADGVLLVARFDAQLNSWLSAEVSRRMDRPTSANLVQIRQEGSAAIDAQRRLTERVGALEAGQAENLAVLGSLGVGTVISRERVVLDPQLRKIVIRMPDEADAERRALLIAAIAATRQAHPMWAIEREETPPQSAITSDPVLAPASDSPAQE